MTCYDSAHDYALPTGQALDGIRRSLPRHHLMLIGANSYTHGARFGLDDRDHLIGRGSEADVWLDDVTVANAHARLVPTPDGWRIEDLGSLAGTWVNRRPIDVATVEDGDLLRVGTFVFLMVRASPSSAPASVRAVPTRSMVPRLPRAS